MNFQSVRSAFPIFEKQLDLVYLDSAATALKPTSVIAAEVAYYTDYSANIARGIYPLAERATEAFEQSRATIASFLGGAKPEEIIFTAGTTASLNLVASLLTSRVTSDHAVLVTAAEHHSNFLPWKELAKETGAQFVVAPVTATGEIDLTIFAKHLTEQTAVLACTAVSNVLGIINPIAEMVKIARAKNPHIVVIVDAAQAVGHLPVRVTDWDADFVTFSGHKLFGPTGIGVLYGKQTLLSTLPPKAFGGGMVLDACAPETLYKESPARFEAGTPHIAGAIGLGEAIRFVEAIGLDNIHSHELDIITYTLRRLNEAFGDNLRIIGPTDPEKKSSIISFVLDGMHPHDTASLLGEQNICVRAGLQCAAPLHEALNLSASTRISLSVYNTEADIDRFVAGLTSARTVFSRA